jgi:hypothetical protein
VGYQPVTEPAQRELLTPADATNPVAPVVRPGEIPSQCDVRSQLIWDAADELLPKSTRKELHAAIETALETSTTSAETESVGDEERIERATAIARHYERADESDFVGDGSQHLLVTDIQAIDPERLEDRRGASRRRGRLGVPKPVEEFRTGTSGNRCETRKSFVSGFPSTDIDDGPFVR